MLRGMIFVDHMNFDIALQNHYKSLGLQTPKLDYNVLFFSKIKDFLHSIRMKLDMEKHSKAFLRDTSAKKIKWYPVK